MQWLFCVLEENRQDRLRPRAIPISEEETEDDLFDRFDPAMPREYQVSCDGPFTAEGEPTGECKERSPACYSGAESHERARDLGWLVNEDGHGWDACPVHRDYEEKLN